MTQFGTQGGKGVLAHSALLSCAYNGERVQFIVWEDQHQHPKRHTQERPKSRLLSQLESLESRTVGFISPFTSFLVDFQRLKAGVLTSHFKIIVRSVQLFH